MNQPTRILCCNCTYAEVIPPQVRRQVLSRLNAAGVTFDAYGVPDNGGSIVIQVGTEQRKITVDADTGKASVQ